MRRYIMLVALAVAAAALAAPAFAGGGKSSSDAIWIVGPTGAAPVSSVKYGATFEAGYSTGAKAPVGLVECWANSTTQLAYPTSGVIWSGYRFPQADGNIGLFTLSDPLNQEWMGGGANCTLSLQQVRSNGTIVTMATMNFTAGS